MSELQALLDRVRAAKGADRELDAAIMAACFDWAKDEPPYYAPHCAGDEPIYWHAPDWARKKPCPQLTASIDAALALVERVLPGWHGSLHWGEVRGERFAECEIGSICERAATPALAILAAMLTALIAAAPDLLEQANWNRKCRDLVDRLLAEAGYAEDSSARHNLAMMNFDAIAKAEGRMVGREGFEPPTCGV